MWYNIYLLTTTTTTTAEKLTSIITPQIKHLTQEIEFMGGSNLAQVPIN